MSSSKASTDSRFYSGTGYDITTYPPANRAANLSATDVSPNGRFVSLARWNRPLLLPTANPASAVDFTPAVSGTGAFTSPQWILTARNGSNPMAWSPGLIDAGTNAQAVTGRYAYTIYDEGGLLDATSAGHSTGTTPQQTDPSLIMRTGLCERKHTAHERKSIDRASL